MSNALAISATTLTLQSLLTRATADVSLLPPDKARDYKQDGGEWLNLFLYQTILNGAWRNADMPRQVRSGETGHPPLALNLHYLITAYGENEARGHEILGRAMSILHDHMLLDGLEIERVTAGALPDSDLHRQLERVRIMPIPLSLEEISKMWSGFQTQYRLSTAYEAAVVLIESTRPPRAPLPVLRQGKDDRGAASVPGGAARLDAALPPDGLIAAPLGALLTLKGGNLGGDLLVRFRHARLTGLLELALEAGGDSAQRQVKLPTGSPAIDDWLPGFYTVSLVTRPAPDVKWSSNEAPLALAPSITVTPNNSVPGDIDLTLTCRPRIRDGQPVLLLLGERQVLPDTVTTPVDPTQPTTLTFGLADVEAGDYVVRLRVDGVDSLPFRRVGTPPLLEFDPAQKLVVA
jgi:hypothetical protein